MKAKNTIIIAGDFSQVLYLVFLVIFPCSCSFLSLSCCHICFFHSDKVPAANNLRGRGFSLAHGFISLYLCSAGCIAFELVEVREGYGGGKLFTHGSQKSNRNHPCCLISSFCFLYCNLPAYWTVTLMFRKAWPPQLVASETTSHKNAEVCFIGLLCNFSFNRLGSQG